MIHLRTYFMTALLVCSTMSPLRASPAGSNGGDFWSPGAQLHYVKQAGYGAAEGAAVLLATAVLTNGRIPSTESSQAASALVGLFTTFLASRYIRNNSEANIEGAQEASPGIAWLSNAAGYLALGGTAAAIFLKK